MANALERHLAGPTGWETKEELEAAIKPPARSDAAEILAGVDQEKANELLRVFDESGRIMGVTMGEVMWAVAMLQARCLASAELGAEQEWAARRFHELVQLALPAMMMAVEKAKREGKPPSDA